MAEIFRSIRILVTNAYSVVHMYFRYAARVVAISESNLLPILRIMQTAKNFLKIDSRIIGGLMANL